MKATITTKEQPKRFQPITMEFTFETVEEARLMFHVLNRGNLKEVLQRSDADVYHWNYTIDIAEKFNTGYTALKNAIREQGYEL